MNTLQKISHTGALNVIKLFGKALPGKELSYQTVNAEAIKRGYIVHPLCCTNAVYEWIKEQPVDYNATFYKEWSNVESKSRTEIWYDQIINYIFNYGIGKSMIPNDGSEQPVWDDLKPIHPISSEDARSRVLNMLYANVAYKQNTITQLFSIVDPKEVDVNKMSNKEAMMLVCKSTGLLPEDPHEMVRFLVYLITGDTLLIRSKTLLTKIKSVLQVQKNTLSNVLVNYMNQYGLEKLSQVFLNKKAYFLAMKNTKTGPTINKLRKLAKKNHKPMIANYWKELLSNPKLIEALPGRLGSCSNLTKISILQTINIRNKKFPARFYQIRNGKLWVDETTAETKKYYSIIYDMVYKSLVSSLSENAEKVYIPAGVRYAMPTSEKTFIGKFPLGTAFDFSGQNAIIGIHRTKENASGFLDFSLNTSDGMKIGWNNRFTGESNKILFSGDVCHNDNSMPAVELFYAKQGFDKNYIAKVNNYDAWNSGKEIPFTLFLATEKIDKIQRNYMVDPNNIVFNIPMVVPTDSKEISVGVFTKDKFILAEFKTGNKTVAGKSITNLYADYAVEIADCYLDLGEVLADAGYDITLKKPINGEYLDLSIDTLAKDSILNIIK